ncbi:MAG: hypothetical protein LC768_11025, partial [Acidobacteria bacterium]|nr:hypothetical protein [Acidobacteriota bacterium]
MKTITIKFNSLLLLASIFFQTTATVKAQQATAKESDINAQIRKEATAQNSQIMRTLYYFTDVYGPRLTGSPN